MKTYIFINADDETWKCDFNSNQDAINNKECYPNTKVITDVLGNVIWNAEENHGPKSACSPDPVISKG